MNGRVLARSKRWAAGAAAALALTGTTVVGLTTPAAAAAVTLYVGAGGTTSTCTTPGAGACPHVADAITASQSGPYAGDDVTIEVAAGTYTENDTITVSSSNSLTIAGAGGPTTTVNGGGVGSVFCIRGGTVTLSGLTITNGVTSPACDTNGGGGVDDQGNLTLSEDTLSNDSAPGGNGGAVWNDLAITSAFDTTFVDDSAASGGAFYAWGSSTLVNDTFVNDSATTGGGAVFVEPFSSTSTTMAYDTLSNDAAPTGGGVDNNGGTVVVDNSILNSAGCQGSFTDGGANVESDNSCGFGPSDVVASASIDLAGSLAANGSSGPQTLAIDQASSAVGEVPSGACAPIVTTSQQPSVTVTTDERGQNRPGQTGASTCDAGAYELQFTTANTSCTTGSQCSASIQTPTQTVTVTGPKGATAPAQVSLSVASQTLSCPAFSYFAPVATLTDSGFTGTILTVTDKVSGLPSKKGVLVCYQPVGPGAPAPELLSKCHGSKAAPCYKSVVEVAGSAVVTLHLLPGDPRFHIGGETPVVTGFSPASPKAGKKLTIKGANLSEVTRVTIGGTPARIIKTAPTKVGVIAPPQAHGVVVVTSLAGATASVAVVAVA